MVGGESDRSKGWFVRPTVIRTSDPRGKLMSEEIFGPVLTVYVYPDEKFEETLEALRYDLALRSDRERSSPGTRARSPAPRRPSAGARGTSTSTTSRPERSSARQPFGGARRSGTNDKAGSVLNMLRWLSPRNIKENAVLPDDWRRPFMG